MSRRSAVAFALLIAISACGDDDAATTSQAPPTTAAPGPSGPMVDGFDGSTAMEIRYFADRAGLEWLEGGVLRLTRTGEGEGGFGITGLYPGTHSDATFTVRFRPIPTDDTAAAFGIVMLGDADLLHFLEATVLLGYGSLTVIPVLEGYPSDYVYGDNAVTDTMFAPADWNELQMTLAGGRLDVSLNGTLIASLEGLPTTPGRFGLVLSTTQQGQGVEIDEFRMEPAG